jgi:hypothetical protein
MLMWRLVLDDEEVSPEGVHSTVRLKSDAERWLAQQRSLTAQDDWIDLARGRITFGEYSLAWLDSRTDLKPKTRHQYNWLLTLHTSALRNRISPGPSRFPGSWPSSYQRPRSASMLTAWCSPCPAAA